MKESILERNREYSNKFIQNIENFKISSFIDENIDFNEISSLIDLGCGDGGFLNAVNRGFPQIELFGTDISERRILGIKKRIQKGNFFCGDVLNTGTRKKFDLVYSNQVIEHVEDDKKMVEEIFRLLADSGKLYLSSVMKKPWAIYRYRNKGKFLLDPTHEREYSSVKNFLDLFKDKFKLIKFRRYPVVMPKWGLQVKIPGYYILEGIWEKRK